MKKINWGKVAIIATAVLGVAGVAWYIMKSLKTPKNINASNPPQKKALPSGGGIFTDTSMFPLQQGSVNSTVKKLQTALGVTADGNFGPNTLAALQNQYGISSVPNQTILSSIINGTSTAATNRALAQSLVDTFAAGSTDIYVEQDYFAQEISEVATGSISYTGYGFQMTSGETYDGTIYTLNGVTLLGMVIINVLSGSLMGEYVVDPNCIVLTNATLPASAPIQAGSTDSSATPVTDSNGLTTF